MVGSPFIDDYRLGDILLFIPIRGGKLYGLLSTSMGTLCLLNQSIPRMTSMPFESKPIRLAGVRVFLSYGGRFLIRFAPTGSQWRAEHVYANLNRRRATTKPGNAEAAWTVLVDGEGGLR
jgi:hypothetical protein